MAKRQLRRSAQRIIHQLYTNATATVSEPDCGSEEASDSSFSYGVGVSYRIDSKLSINADYMSYLNKTDYSAKGFTIGLGLQF